MQHGDSNAETAIALPIQALKVSPSAPSPVGTRAIPLGKAWTWLGVSSLILLFAAIWTVIKPYLGLVHDARLYALQTAAKLKPDIFLGDLFLRYGSQDSFTVFPWVYAPLAQVLGLEHAAAVLTFVAAIVWLSVGFLIARELSGTRLALLALGLLIVTPGWYGGFEVFQIGEMFLSARLPAEVFALGALLAYLRRKYVLAMMLCAGSALIHPLMAIPVIGVILLAAVREHLGAHFFRASLVAAFAVPIVMAAAMPIGSVDPNGEWLSVLRTRSPFLFPGDWRSFDWQVHILTWVTLFIGSRVLADSRSSNLATCAAWVGLTGVALAIVAAAWPDQPALLMAQPWRWMWVSRFLSIIMLPLVIFDLWRRGPNTSERTACLFLVSGWLLAESIGGLVGLIAFAVVATQDRFSPSLRRSAHVGAAVVLFASVIGTGIASLQFAGYSLDNNEDPAWVQAAMRFLGEAPTAALVVTAGWAVVVLGRSRIGLVAFAAVGIAAATAVGPRAISGWSTSEYSAATFEAFSPWRKIIPPDAEVLWLGGDPMATWLLLERRSYLSFDQLAGVLYSPRMLPELQRRTRALSSLTSPDWWTGADGSLEAKPKDLTPGILAKICEAPGLNYVVSDRGIGGAVSHIQWPFWEIEYYLYACRPTTAAGADRESTDT